jgi:hypothetical protein
MPCPQARGLDGNLFSGIGDSQLKCSDAPAGLFQLARTGRRDEGFGQCGGRNRKVGCRYQFECASGTRVEGVRRIQQCDYDARVDND